MRRLLATVILALLAVGYEDQEPSVVRPDNAAVSLPERGKHAAQNAEALATAIDNLTDDNKHLVSLKDGDNPVGTVEVRAGATYLTRIGQVRGT